MNTLSSGTALSSRPHRRTPRHNKDEEALAKAGVLSITTPANIVRVDKFSRFMCFFASSAEETESDD